MAEPQNQLILNVNNTRPIIAADLGRLFSSLALDYQQATGRQLAIVQLEPGSVVAFFQEVVPYFKDAAEFADSVNHLVDFAKNLAEIAILALGGVAVSQKIFGSGGANGARTVESIAKIAISAGATVELYDPSSQKPTLKVTPADGRRIRKFAARNRKLKKPVSKDANTLEISTVTRTAIADAVRRGDHDSKRLVAALAEMLKQRKLGNILLEMADEFERDGESAAANLLREAHAGRLIV